MFLLTFWNDYINQSIVVWRIPLRGRTQAGEPRNAKTVRAVKPTAKAMEMNRRDSRVLGVKERSCITPGKIRAAVESKVCKEKRVASMAMSGC